MLRRFRGNENPGIEKRESPRTGIQIWVKEKTGGCTSFHLASNISLSGLHIEKKLPFQLGSVVSLEMTLSDPNDSITLKAVVVNTYMGYHSDVTGTGLKFVEMDEDVKKKLAIYIRKINN